MTQQQIPASQVNNATNQNGLLQTNVVVQQRYWLRLRLTMDRDGGGTQNAGNLPYLVVRFRQASSDWVVVSTDRTQMSSGEARFSIPGEGQYRLYIKEPGQTFAADAIFTIPFHQLADGTASTREVQPVVQLAVESTGAQTFSVTRQHPNSLTRAADLYPTVGQTATLNNQHVTSAHALDTGTHNITNQLWSDASQTYGRTHAAIDASDHAAALRIVYGETLQPDTAQQHGRLLQDNNRTIRFDSMTTQGGRGTRRFADNQMMSADECLRKTHPSVMDFWLTAMASLNLVSSRVTGAWRPHSGSTRHRYSQALDLTHLQRLQDDGGEAVMTEIHLHTVSGADAKPTATDQQANTAVKRRKRAISQDFHRYLAQQRQSGTLGWLGGPWALRYSDVGLTGAALFIQHDAIHVHHVHLSVGTDQGN